jgi:formate hydrogenlyase subunit 3/multisubunit Na+/H+ antiporter MnhD subunit
VSAVAWLAPLLLPLLAAPAVLLRASRRRWLLAVAPVPALVLALVGEPGPAPDLAWVLFDTQLALDPIGRLLLAMTATVWIAAGLSVGRDVGAGFAALALVTLAGNVTLLVAGDVVGLYAGFAVMTFAAYGLVVHDRTPAALRAGRVYVVLAAVGEVLLLSGLLLAVAEAGATAFEPVSAAIASSGRRDLIVGLLLAGFGVKAGVIPLHVWLPLAHPAAPIPASAVLSGTMIKAGLVGWLRVLPLGEVALPGWSTLLLVSGLAGAFLAVVAGLLQDDPKVVLAYSSISQMGLIAVTVAVGLAVPPVAAAAAVAAAVHALHHGLAKGALFLGVGVARSTSTATVHRWVLAGMAVASLSLAGLPLTSGWIAKGAAKQVVVGAGGALAGPLTWALSLAAVGTTVLLLRLLWLLRRPGGVAPAGTAVAGTAVAGTAVAGTAVAGSDVARTRADRPATSVPTIAWASLVGVLVVATWALPPRLVPGGTLPAPTIGGWWEGVWPVGLGLVLGALVGAVAAMDRRGARRARRLSPAGGRGVTCPAGDLVVPAEATVGWVGRQGARLAPVLAAARQVVLLLRRAAYLAVLPGRGLDRVDRWLTRWRTVGASFVLVLLALVVALAGPPG